MHVKGASVYLSLNACQWCTLKARWCNTRRMNGAAEVESPHLLMRQCVRRNGNAGKGTRLARPHCSSNPRPPSALQTDGLTKLGSRGVRPMASQWGHASRREQAQVAVVGAGVVGLSTALCIQKHIPGCSLTLVADRFIEDTLSFGAAGFFRPDENIGPALDVTRGWFRATFRHYETLLRDNTGEAAGIKRLSGYALSSSNPDKLVNGTMRELCVGLRPIAEQELRNFPPKYKHGIFYNSILADPRKYLKWLTGQIIQNGGNVRNQVIKDLRELSDFCVVVNCSGLRAKDLTEDPLLTPVRGQVIKVSAPWVTQFYYADGCYILPGTEYVTLGGTKQLGDWNTGVSQHDRDYIWDTCTTVLPSLKDARVIEDWVGLRPFRQPIRIEAEVLGSSVKQCKVVHNYGHGAHGINTSWGTALQATSLVRKMLEKETDHTLAKL